MGIKYLLLFLIITMFSTGFVEMPAVDSAPVEVELNVDSSDADGVKFVAPESGFYKICIVGGAYCYMAEDEPEFQGWRTRIELYINKPVEWGEPDEWGEHPINQDAAIGPVEYYPTYAEAEAAGQGSSATFYLEKNEYVIAIVSDGSDYYYDNRGVVKTSIVVEERTSTSISIALSATTVNKGESITVSGLISPAVSGVTVHLTYIKAGVVEVERTVTTASDGSFTDTYTPDAGGSWGVTARWEGNDRYQGATSSPATFEVIDKECIVATSTFDSELAPEVQFLRGFREKTVYSTFAGSQFMKVFDAFYYSWSPGIAGFLWDNPTYKPIMRSLLSPLLGILHLSTTVNVLFNFNNEVGIIVTGLLASFLIGVVYFAPATMIPLLVVKRIGKKSFPKVSRLRILLFPWLLAMVLVFVGELTASPLFTMAGTGTLVVFTVALSAGTIALKVSGIVDSLFTH